MNTSSSIAKPKRTAIKTIGRKLSTGALTSVPKTLPSQPDWKTATTAPSVAAMESREPSAALIGTTTERKTISSRSSASPTTSATNGSNDELSRSDTSIITAVRPVTETCPEVDASGPCSSSRMPLSLKRDGLGPHVST